jgi:parallel beta-helix repeat protein
MKSNVATIYVNPVTGNDANAGSRLSPFKTITRAVQAAKSKSPTMIRLAPATYSTASGEKFPLIIPQGITLVGNESNQGQGIIISGSGDYNSPSFGSQNITLLLLDDAILLGVTVINSIVKGTGVWIESTNPTLANNTFTNCGREGLFVSGNAKPAITDNIFIKNNAGGVVIARNSKGELLRNTFQKNGLGLAISDAAAPLVANNKLIENQIAIALSRDARPVLRTNLIEKNPQGGLLINGNSIPDLGNSQDFAGNIFRENGEFDIQNITANKLFSAGNLVNPSRVKGLIELLATVDNDDKVGENNIFTDIGGHWAAEFIETLVKKGWMSGLPDDTFAPNSPINRAQFAAVVAKAFQVETKNQIPNFSDIKRDFWAAPAIAAAASMGFISGFPDGTFRPNLNVTKIQAISSITNGLKLNGSNPNVISIYSDRVSIPSYATNAVAVATQNLLIVNYPQPEQLEPLRDITRAEVAGLIYQGLVTQGILKPIISPYIVIPIADAPSFKDLAGHWAEDFIRALASMNLSNGFADGTYQPDKPMTRGEYAELVATAFNPPAKRGIPDFVDIAKESTTYQTVRIAASGGFVGGFSDRTFRPKQNVQRLQVIVSLVSGLGLSAAKADSLHSLQRYRDQNLIPQSARAAVASATIQNIVANYPDIQQIQPDRDATRGEVAAMVYQALVAIGRVPKINSPYIVS